MIEESTHKIINRYRMIVDDKDRYVGLEQTLNRYNIVSEDMKVVKKL